LAPCRGRSLRFGRTTVHPFCYRSQEPTYTAEQLRSTSWHQKKQSEEEEPVHHGRRLFGVREMERRPPVLLREVLRLQRCVDDEERADDRPGERAEAADRRPDEQRDREQRHK